MLNYVTDFFSLWTPGHNVFCLILLDCCVILFACNIRSLFSLQDEVTVRNHILFCRGCLARVTLSACNIRLFSYTTESQFTRLFFSFSGLCYKTECYIRHPPQSNIDSYILGYFLKTTMSFLFSIPYGSGVSSLRESLPWETNVNITWKWCLKLLVFLY